MAIWTIDTALAHVNGKKDVLGGIAYTMWNDSRTLKTQNNFRFYGELTEKGDAGKKDAQACDMVFVIPTDHEGITSLTRKTNWGETTLKELQEDASMV